MTSKELHEGYAFTRGIDYGSILTASERVAWTVDGTLRHRQFDPSRPIVPSSWVGDEALAFLDDRDRVTLNHCRAFSYVHLLGGFEEFAPPHVTEAAGTDWHDDRTRLRALLRFGEEEMKHQQLFLRAEQILEESCAHAFGRYFDDEARLVRLTAGILGHPPLARFLIVLALEWGTQRHYVESIRSLAETRADTLYVDILKAHWVEEAQHIKVDVLEIARLAGQASAEELAAAFDHLLAIGSLVEAAFVGQAECEIETLSRVTGHTFSASESDELRDALSRSLGHIFAGVGLSHPAFASVARELSAAGAARLGIT